VATKHYGVEVLLSESALESLDDTNIIKRDLTPVIGADEANLGVPPIG